VTRDRARWGWFCDFDGTISENDMIREIMLHFVPEQTAPLIERVNRRELSVRAGVEAMFACIPSRWFDDVRAFAIRQTRIRDGFGLFVEAVTGSGHLLAVTSGGFDFFVEPALAPWRDKLTVYCNRIDASGEFLRVIWPHPCDAACRADCGLCKPSILRRHKPELAKAIVIGDGVTDYQAARLADFVFARSRLLDECRRQGLPHAPFDTFHDILAALDKPAHESVMKEEEHRP
jgi:2-hydroxy-3-keto-5-methylthiopentenyl-1-phosphate phosphatase